MTLQDLEDLRADELANEWNVSFVEKRWREKDQFYVHGHFSTISETKLKAIEKYLADSE